jgi:hypothetical protein
MLFLETRGPSIERKITSMKKRLLTLFAVVAITLTIVPSAMADHCYLCYATSSTTGICLEGRRIGNTECDDTFGNCVMTGEQCTHGTAVASLASEYVVASVERLDEPQKAAETLVAAAAVPQHQPAQR